MSFDRVSKGRMDRVFDLIYLERVRQQRLKEEGKFLYSCADPIGLTPSQKYLVLAEEVGEVAQVVLNLHGFATDFPASDAEALHDKLRQELTEVAAVAVAWLEALDLEPVERLQL